MGSSIGLVTLLAAAVVAAVGSAEDSSSGRQAPVVFVHLSDIHFSVNTHGEWCPVKMGRRGNLFGEQD